MTSSEFMATEHVLMRAIGQFEHLSKLRARGADIDNRTMHLLDHVIQELKAHLDIREAEGDNA